MQAPYAAVDLAPPVLRDRHLSMIVGATTLGAVVGPNLAAFAGASIADLGVPTIARSRPHRLWRSWHGRLA